MPTSDPSVEFYSRINKSISLNKKFELFHRHADAIGFTDVYYCRYSYDHLHELVPTVFEVLDPDWAEKYQAEGYAEVDWVRNEILKSPYPIRFDEPKRPLTPQEDAFLKSAHAHGRMNGFAMSFRSSGKTPALFFALSTKARPSDEQIGRVSAAACLFDLVVAAELAKRTAKTVGLTPREINLIRLLEKGYSSVQIAGIVGSSEQWIRKSFMSIREKLGVGNNVELVLRASELQLVGNI